jgi:sortase A
LTTVDTGSQGTVEASSSGSATSAPQPGPSAPHPGERGAVRATITCLVLALVLVLGFFVYLFGLSHISESRAQAGMFKNFVAQLAGGTAPVNPTITNANGSVSPLPEGTPVAVLNIPQIGLHDVVVVEGTSSRDLALGPGHTVSSALPGQTGLSVIYGKAVTYGAPFAHLMQLNRGDRFTVTTGQGTATYQVESFGTSTRPAPADSTNRLVLETAASGFFPSTAVQVSADLVSAPETNPDDWPDIPSDEVDMASDAGGGLVPLTLWSQALLLAVIIATFGVYRWSRWRTYLLMTPVVLALTWCVYENLACLLPNLY